MPLEPFFLFVLAGSVVVTVVLVFGGLVLTGHAKLRGSAGLVADIIQRVPELGTLPENQQVSIVKWATLWPALLALGVLMAFVLISASNLAVLNFINASSRAASVVGIALLVLIIPPFIWLRLWIVRRKVRCLRG